LAKQKDQPELLRFDVRKPPSFALCLLFHELVWPGYDVLRFPMAGSLPISRAATYFEGTLWLDVRGLQHRTDIVALVIILRSLILCHCARTFRIGRAMRSKGGIARGKVTLVSRDDRMGAFNQQT
jgi:hypothetical protein